MTSTAAYSTVLDLPSATTISGSESFWIVQGGTDKRTTVGAALTAGATIPYPTTTTLGGVFASSTPAAGTTYVTGLSTSGNLTLTTISGSNITGTTGSSYVVLAYGPTVKDLTLQTSDAAFTTQLVVSTAANSSATFPAGTYTLAGSSVPLGGTGSSTFTQNGVIIGNGTNALTATSAGTAGQLLIGQSSAPSWQTISGAVTISCAGVTSLTGFTSYALLVGRGTGSVTTITAGTAGQVLIGQSSDPAFQTLSGPVSISSAGATALTGYTSNGVLIGQGAGSSVVATTAGTSGQVLTAVTGGAPTFQTPGMQLLTVLTANNSSIISTSSVFTSMYDDYAIVIDNLVPNLSTGILCQIQIVGGGYQNASYLNGTATTSAFDIGCGAIVSTVAGTGLSGWLTLHNINSTSVRKIFVGRPATFQSAGTMTGLPFNSMWNGGSDAISGISFFTSSNLLSGKVKIYGLRPST